MDFFCRLRPSHCFQFSFLVLYCFFLNFFTNGSSLSLSVSTFFPGLTDSPLKRGFRMFFVICLGRWSEKESSHITLMSFKILLLWCFFRTKPSNSYHLAFSLLNYVPLCSIHTKESAQHRLLSSHHCRNSSPVQSLIPIPKGPIIPSAKSRCPP